MNNSSGEYNNIASDDTPIFVSYLILSFRIISTIYITIIGIAVTVTVIKEKHNIKGRQILLIINLMVSGILSAVNATVQSSIMIVSYIAGMNDPIRCDILFITLFTFQVNAFAFLLLSIDKFVAITTPLRYNSIITNWTACIMIIVSWTLSIIISLVRMIMKETYRKSSQYGVCIPNPESFGSVMINFIAPIFVSFLVALIIDIYLSVLACKLNKRLHHHSEEGLQQSTLPQRSIAGASNFTKLLQRIDRITGYNVKPIVAVLIGLSSNSLLGFVCPILFATVGRQENRGTYKFLVEHVIIPNTAYCFLIVYSLIYSLYFRNIREPMCMMFKQWFRLICPLCVRRCLKFHFRNGRKRNQIVPTPSSTTVSSTNL